jgi:glutathione S-transferase kappa 1
MSKITLYYDIISPYTWLAFEVLHRYESIWKIPVDYQPFLLGGVMKATQNVPPGSNPFKLKYMMGGKWDL